MADKDVSRKDFERLMKVAKEAVATVVQLRSAYELEHLKLQSLMKKIDKVCPPSC